MFMKSKQYNNELQILKASYSILLRDISLGNDNEASKKRRHGKNWVTELEYVGYGTKMLILAMRDYYGDYLTDHLPSIRVYNDQVVINEVDREKITRKYCEVNDLVDNIRNIVYIDNTLYKIVIHDVKIWSDIECIYENGNRYYVLKYKRSGSYSKKLAPSIRRVDHML